MFLCILCVPQYNEISHSQFKHIVSMFNIFKTCTIVSSFFYTKLHRLLSFSDSCNGVKLPLLSDLPDEDEDPVIDDNQPEYIDKTHEEMSQDKQNPHSNPDIGTLGSRAPQTESGISKVKITGISFTLDALNTKPTTAEYKEEGPIAVRIKPQGFKNSQDNELFETADKKGKKYDDDTIKDLGKDYVGSPINKADPNTVTDSVMSNAANARSTSPILESSSGLVKDYVVTPQTMEFTSQTEDDKQAANLQTPGNLDSDEMEKYVPDDSFLTPDNLDSSKILKDNDVTVKAETKSQSQVTTAFDTGIQSQNGSSMFGADTGRLQDLLKSFLGNMLQSKKKVNIYHGCSADLQCPAHAYCTSRGCTQLKQCLCSEGFMVNRNGTKCIPGK